MQERKVQWKISRKNVNKRTEEEQQQARELLRKGLYRFMVSQYVFNQKLLATQNVVG